MRVVKRVNRRSRYACFAKRRQDAIGETCRASDDRLTLLATLISKTNAHPGSLGSRREQNPMTVVSRSSLSILVLSVALLGVSARSFRQSSSKSAAEASEVKRGGYLVEEVAKCTECHTPRDSNGQLDPNRWLQGAPIWITPVHPTGNWAQRAPALAGFPGYSDADATNILEKGTGAERRGYSASYAHLPFVPLRRPRHRCLLTVSSVWSRLRHGR